jgi:TolB protein
MRKLKVCTVFIVIVFAASPQTSRADLTSFPICTWELEQSCPAVSGSNVVWMDRRWGGYDIYRNIPADVNDVNGIPVCTEGGYQKNPAISGNLIVWQDERYSATKPDIFGYNITTASGFSICEIALSQTVPVISGDTIVWQDFRNNNNDIYCNGSPPEICTDAASQSNPAISGHIVVWQDARNGGMDIYSKNIDTGQEGIVCVNGYWKQNPAISGNVVVWQDNRNGDNDIYGKNLSNGQEIVICQHTGEQINPAISGDIVVWEDCRSGNPHIYGYRISTQTEIPICTLISYQKNPAIDSNFVVWEDYRNGNADIFGGYIPTPVSPSRITVLDPNGGEMFLAGSKCTINWQCSGTPLSGVKIEYSTNGGQSFSVIDANAANTGTYVWQPLPIVDSNQCLIKISDKTIPPAASDVSDHVFTIFECSTSLTADLNGDCKVDFLDFALFHNQWLTCGNPYDSDWCN